MTAFPDLGHAVLRELERAFSAEKEDIGADAGLKKGPFHLETESYRLPGLGQYCILRMTALLGLMKMETLVLAPTERDLPLLNLDRVRVPGKDTQIAELYDTQLSPWPEESQAVFRSLRERENDPDRQIQEGRRPPDDDRPPECFEEKSKNGFAFRFHGVLPPPGDARAPPARRGRSG